tara:strand:- start:286 stop:528 length:243 start_codon:yes stop_codon:yes gene_type:complete
MPTMEISKNSGSREDLLKVWAERLPLCGGDSLPIPEMGEPSRIAYVRNLFFGLFFSFVDELWVTAWCVLIARHPRFVKRQ